MKKVQGVLATAISVLLLIVSGSSCTSDHSESDEVVVDPHPLTDIQAAVATYLYLPQFSFPEFAAQVFQLDVTSQGYDPVNKLVYFSIPKSLSQDSSSALSKISSEPEKIEFATGYEAINWLGPDLERDRDTSRMIIRFPAETMVLDSSTILQRTLGKRKISVSLAELAASFRHKFAYNSPALALAPGPGDISYVIANHAAPMSDVGDPILEKFIEGLLSEKQKTQTDTAQVLLDFVTKSIKYTHHGDLEIFMRPIDVLLAGEADCSGKVILYGSLLNQVNIPFLLVYLDGHITIGVGGKFSKNNGMFFLHEGDTYTLAETTAEGFEIGKSELIEPMETWHYKFLQKPGKTEKLFDLWRNDSLEFADRVDLAGYRAPAVR